MKLDCGRKKKYAAELGMSVVSVKCDPQAYLGSANDDYFSFMDKYLLDWNPPEGFSITVRFSLKRILVVTREEREVSTLPNGQTVVVLPLENWLLENGSVAPVNRSARDSRAHSHAGMCS